MQLANELGEPSVDGMLKKMSRRDFDERIALKILENREREEPPDDPTKIMADDPLAAQKVKLALGATW